MSDCPWFQKYVFHSPEPKKPDKVGSSSSITAKGGKEKAKSKKKAATKGKAWTCEVCLKKFTGTDDQIVECERCENHYCITCIEMSEDVYENLHRPDLFWFCPDCARQIRLRNSLKDTMDSFMDTVSDKFDELERKFDQKLQQHSTQRLEQIEKKLASFDFADQLQEINSKVDEVSTELKPEQVKKTFAEAASNLGKNEASTKEIPIIIKKAMTDQKNEEKMRESRESNIIIHRIEESKEPSAEARVKYDTELFDKLCVTALGIGKVEVNKIIRLGQKNEQNKRPMRVALKNKDDRVSLSLSLRKLKVA